MAEREVQRRLAAILAADVAGYTQLMEKDTEGTVAAWQAARADVIRPQSIGYSGKLVKLTAAGRGMREKCIRSVDPLLVDMEAEFGGKRITRALPLLKEVRKYLDDNRD